MTDIIAGITIPDSTVARAATELVRDVDTDLLYHHSRRASCGAASKPNPSD